MKGISTEIQRDLILSVGVRRGERRLSPVEVAQILDRAVLAGSTTKDIANEILLDTTMITRFRRLLNLSPDIQHLIGWRGRAKLSFSTASEIACLSSSIEQQEVVKTALENRLSKSEVIQIVEMRNRLNKPIQQCISEVLLMRPKIKKQYLFIGAIKSPEIQAKLSKISQLTRDQLLKKVISSHNPELPPWEGSLGGKKFSLFGEENLYEVIAKWPTDFESNVNAYLESELS